MSNRKISSEINLRPVKSVLIRPPLYRGGRMLSGPIRHEVYPDLSASVRGYGDPRGKSEAIEKHRILTENEH